MCIWGVCVPCWGKPSDITGVIHESLNASAEGCEALMPASLFVVPPLLQPFPSSHLTSLPFAPSISASSWCIIFLPFHSCLSLPMLVGEMTCYPPRESAFCVWEKILYKKNPDNGNPQLFQGSVGKWWVTLLCFWPPQLPHYLFLPALRET